MKYIADKAERWRYCKLFGDLAMAQSTMKNIICNRHTSPEAKTDAEDLLGRIRNLDARIRTED